MKVQDSVAFVTGANRGLGAALVQALLAGGARKVYAAARPVLARHGGGAIVNVLSVLSWLNIPQAATYSASKAAAWSLTNGLRGELRAQGTQVLGLHVGYIDTDMASGVSAPKARPEDVTRQVLEALEAGREEVLADEISRQVKLGLSDDRGIYLGDQPDETQRRDRR
jgi:NAD(P)-dependent dehydrogenase (short-subunit alcohol dehydrogenase family)